MRDLYIDLTDLVLNSIYHGVNTGIQHVQINVAYRLVSTISAKTFSIYEGRWEDLDTLIMDSHGEADQFLCLIREKYKAHVLRIERQKKSPFSSLPSRIF